MAGRPPEGMTSAARAQETIIRRYCQFFMIRAMLPAIPYPRSKPIPGALPCTAQGGAYQGPTPADHNRSPMALRLAGHGDEPDRSQHLAFQARLGAGDPHEVLVVATDRSHEPTADLELLQQRLRDVIGRGGGQEDRVVRGAVGPSSVSVADPGADVAITQFAEEGIGPPAQLGDDFDRVDLVGRTRPGRPPGSPSPSRSRALACLSWARSARSSRPRCMAGRSSEPRRSGAGRRCRHAPARGPARTGAAALSGRRQHRPVLDPAGLELGFHHLLAARTRVCSDWSPGKLPGASTRKTPITTTTDAASAVLSTSRSRGVTGRPSRRAMMPPDRECEGLRER